MHTYIYIYAYVYYILTYIYAYIHTCLYLKIYICKLSKGTEHIESAQCRLTIPLLFKISIDAALCHFLLIE